MGKKSSGMSYTFWRTQLFSRQPTEEGEVLEFRSSIPLYRGSTVLKLLKLDDGPSGEGLKCEVIENLIENDLGVGTRVLLSIEDEDVTVVEYDT